MDEHKLVKLLFLFIYLLDYSEAYLPGEHELKMHNRDRYSKEFHNEWTVEIEGGPEVAELVALEFGYIYGREVLGFTDIYVFYKDPHSKDRRNPQDFINITKRLSNDNRVNWAEQSHEKYRVKRDFDSDTPHIRDKRFKQNMTKKKIRHCPKKPYFNDELWGCEWYLQETKEPPNNHIDLNVLPVYKYGINGKGIRIVILDDGLEHTHTDLIENYDPEISWDCNDHDPDPSPVNYENKINSHGTRCAGEIAMTANNYKCGVGVAWGAKIGGVRMLDGPVTDRVEGEALGYAWDKVDIYSASWGPRDDGTIVEGPGRLAAAAIYRGITKGRGGRGTIYVWANGNGGENDNCNCDGYSSSIYTISIGSLARYYDLPDYAESCTSTLAAAYSSGSTELKIVSTDTGDSCTMDHTGTSAAAPLAAGIIALTLQANPFLTWRDVQHLIVWTSETPFKGYNSTLNPLTGLRYDPKIGFGLMNAASMVSAAVNWTNVPEKMQCHVEATQTNVSISSVNKTYISYQANACAINYIEHVEVIVNIQYSMRGALSIYLTSPQETRVQLLSSRPKDKSNKGFVNWSLTSVATWAEHPIGSWILEIQDESIFINEGIFGPSTLIIHGTEMLPEYAKYGPKKSGSNYNTIVEGYKIPEIEKYNIETSDNSEMEKLLDILTQPTGEQNIEGVVDPTILAEVEQELYRIHHRLTKNPFSNIG